MEIVIVVVVVVLCVAVSWGFSLRRRMEYKWSQGGSF